MSRPDREAGSATVEIVVLAPVLFGLFGLAVQVALLSYARQVATTAAQHAAQVARAEHGDARHAERVARQQVAVLGPGLLDEPAVTVTRSATTATVQVQGRALSVVPGLTLTVTGRSSGPLERVTDPP